MWDLRAEPVDGSRRLLKGHEHGIAYFDFLKGGALVTSELYDGLGGPYRSHPRLWEPATRSAPYPDTRIRWSTFNRGSDVLAAIGDAGTLLLYRPRADGSLQEVFRGKDMGGGVTNHRPVGGYALPQRPQFSPRFDRGGRWLVVTSEAGRLTIVDCAPVVPKAYQLADALGASLFAAMVGDGPLLLNSTDGRSNQLDVWDLSGATPRSFGRVHLAWAVDLHAFNPPEMAVALVSAHQVTIAAPARTPGKSEIWSYALPEGTRDARGGAGDGQVDAEQRRWVHCGGQRERV